MGRSARVRQGMAILQGLIITSGRQGVAEAFFRLPVVDYRFVAIPLKIYMTRYQNTVIK